MQRKIQKVQVASYYIRETCNICEPKNYASKNHPSPNRHLWIVGKPGVVGKLNSLHSHRAGPSICENHLANIDIWLQSSLIRWNGDDGPDNKAGVSSLMVGFSGKHLGVSKNKGIPKWMVYNGKPYQNGWFGGTTIFGNTHLHPKTLDKTAVSKQISHHQHHQHQ